MVAWNVIKIGQRGLLDRSRPGVDSRRCRRRSKMLINSMIVGALQTYSGQDGCGEKYGLDVIPIYCEVL